MVDQISDHVTNEKDWKWIWKKKLFLELVYLKHQIIYDNAHLIKKITSSHKITYIHNTTKITTIHEN